MSESLHAIEPLDEKLRSILLQFPCFNSKAFAGPAEFLARLKPFLEKLPADRRYTVFAFANRKTFLGFLFSRARKSACAFCR
jgi:hypothetical protein